MEAFAISSLFNNDGNYHDASNMQIFLIKIIPVDFSMGVF